MQVARCDGDRIGDPHDRPGHPGLVICRCSGAHLSLGRSSSRCRARRTRLSPQHMIAPGPEERTGVASARRDARRVDDPGHGTWIRRLAPAGRRWRRTTRRTRWSGPRRWPSRGSPRRGSPSGRARRPGCQRRGGRTVRTAGGRRDRRRDVGAGTPRQGTTTTSSRPRRRADPQAGTHSRSSPRLRDPHVVPHASSRALSDQDVQLAISCMNAEISGRAGHRLGGPTGRRRITGWEGVTGAVPEPPQHFMQVVRGRPRRCPAHCWRYRSPRSTQARRPGWCWCWWCRCRGCRPST